MPEYDPTHPPKPMTAALTPIEIGRDEPSTHEAGAWPASNLLPDPYTGPAPAREFEAGTATTHRGQPAPAVEPPPDAPAPMKSVSPPPGHTAQP